MRAQSPDQRADDASEKHGDSKRNRENVVHRSSHSYQSRSRYANCITTESTGADLRRLGFPTPQRELRRISGRPSGRNENCVAVAFGVTEELDRHGRRLQTPTLDSSRRDPKPEGWQDAYGRGDRGELCPRSQLNVDRLLGSERHESYSFRRPVLTSCSVGGLVES